MWQPQSLSSFRHRGYHRQNAISTTQQQAVQSQRSQGEIKLNLLINFHPLCVGVCFQYSMSAPKSGRHAHNPVLAPDQQVTYRERRRRENKVDPLSPDYVTLSSPFAVHDVTSRGARLAMGAGGQSSRGGDRRRNPNVVQPKGRRKK